MAEATITIRGRDRSKAAFQSADASVKKLTGRIGALAVAYGALRVTQKVIDIHRKFTATISDLSAITGATGKQLEFLRKKSLEYGATTTLTASQAAEAFKLVASAKPDLLENADALAAVTKQAIILAEASGSTLPEAAITVTLALNQYGASADQAARFINVLAAGAKFGSSEIANTAAALKNSGLVARDAGTSFEELNAVIQVLAKGTIKAEEAGVGLRNIYLNLAIQTNDKFKPAVVGFTQAMKNLKAANLSTTEMLKIFGKKNIVAAKQVIKNADALAILTKRLTGTKTALEQAKVKVDNLDGDIKKMNSAWESVALTLGNRFDPALRSLTQALTWSSKIIKTITIRLSLYGEMIGVVFAATSALQALEFKRAGRILKDWRARKEQADTEIADIWKKVEATKGLEAASLSFARSMIAAEGRPAGGGMATQGETGLTPKDSKVIESLRLRVMTEREIELAAFEQKKQDFTDAAELKIISDTQRDERIEAAKRQHEQRMTQIEKRAARLRAQSSNKWNMVKAKTALGLMAMSTAATAANNKKMFKLNKLASIGQATISTYEGVANALKLPFPLNFAIAAVVAAAGLAQVRAIKSQKFGGGGSAPSLGGSGVTPTSTAPNPSNFASGPPQQQQQQAPRQVFITLQGDGAPSDGYIRDVLIPSINEAVGDGADIAIASR